MQHRILSGLKQYFFTSIDSVFNCAAIAWQIQEMGGNIHFHHHIYATYTVGKEVCSIHTINAHTGELSLFHGNYFFSTIPACDMMFEMSEYNKQYNNLFFIKKRNNNRQIIKTLS
jgi:hypothetical protein